MELNPPESRTRSIRCIVKLGGAAITRKNELEKIHDENLEIVACQLRQAMLEGSAPSKVVGMDWSKRPGSSEISCDVVDLGDYDASEFSKFVVVHGAGSFGHFQASRSGVHRGGLENPIVKAGFVATRISVTNLNLEIVRALAREGIPTIGMSPFSCGWLTSNRDVASADLSTVAKTIESGFVPVLHGDAVLDNTLGCTILSGDVIIRHLADHLKPEYVVFLTDVFGVYDRPPSEPDAVLFKEIAVGEDGSWKVVNPVLEHTDKKGNKREPMLQNYAISLWGLVKCCLVVESNSPNLCCGTRHNRGNGNEDFRSCYDCKTWNRCLHCEGCDDSLTESAQWRIERECT